MQRETAVLTLAYDPEGHQDGGGAQLHRRFALLAYCKSHGIPYLDLPMTALIVPSQSEQITSDQAAIHSWNKVFWPIDHCLEQPKFRKKFRKHTPSSKFLFLLQETRTLKDFWNYLHLIANETRQTLEFRRILSGGIRLQSIISFFNQCYLGILVLHSKRVLLMITNPFHLVVNASAYDSIQSISSSILIQKDPIKIGLHVRRGDLIGLKEDRILPDAYFKRVLKQVINELQGNGKKYSVVVYTEIPKPGNRFHNFGYSKISWEFIDESIENLSVCILEDAESLKHLSNSDIVIGSKSSFSFVAGLLCKGKVIMPSWWIENPIHWITISEAKYEEIGFKLFS
jgi:hypothetical protein